MPFKTNVQETKVFPKFQPTIKPTHYWHHTDKLPAFPEPAGNDAMWSWIWANWAAHSTWRCSKDDLMGTKRQAMCFWFQNRGPPHQQLWGMCFWRSLKNYWKRVGGVGFWRWVRTYRYLLGIKQIGRGDMLRLWLLRLWRIYLLQHSR